MNQVTLNRLHNVTNPNQTDAKRVLCVCSAGLLRSPTLANVLHQEYGYNTRACGATPEYALVPVDEVLVAWADEIVCVSREVLYSLGSSVVLGNCRIVVLDIPDRYKWNDPELIKLISKQYADSMIMERVHETGKE